MSNRRKQVAAFVAAAVTSVAVVAGFVLLSGGGGEREPERKLLPGVAGKSCTEFAYQNSVMNNEITYIQHDRGGHAEPVIETISKAEKFVTEHLAARDLPAELDSALEEMAQAYAHTRELWAGTAADVDEPDAAERAADRQRAAVARIVDICGLPE